MIEWVLAALILLGGGIIVGALANEVRYKLARGRETKCLPEPDPRLGRLGDEHQDLPMPVRFGNVCMPVYRYRQSPFDGQWLREWKDQTGAVHCEVVEDLCDTCGTPEALCTWRVDNPCNKGSDDIEACLICGDPMKYEQGVYTCDCPQRGYKPRGAIS